MRVFFDSSAFVKRYVREDGSDAVLDWCERADVLLLCVIALPELISAFCRLQREGRLDTGQYRRLKQDLLLDIADAQICELAPEVLRDSIHTLEAHPLRAMDALHVAAALRSRADTFVSSDLRQCVAARGLGLAVVQV